MDLEGAELCEVALGDVEEAEPYDEEKDFALWNGAASAALVLERAGSQCLWWRSRISLPLRRRAAIR